MKQKSYYKIRVGIIQRVLADYRKPLFDRLAKISNFSLTVFAGQPHPNEAIKVVHKLEVARLFLTRNYTWQGPGGPLYWQSGILDWLRDFDPQVLILEANPRLFSNWVAIWWMKLRRRPVLGWGLGELERSGPRWYHSFRRRVARTILLRLDGIIAYSSKAKRDYIALGMPAEKVFIAYNAIDNRESEFYLSKFGCDLKWVPFWKKTIGLNSTLPVVLYVGRLIPQKKVDLLIKACIPLLNKCQLLIVGDGPIRSELETLAFPYRKRIHFIRHQVGETLARCFIASDIFVLPGSGGLALHQAMSYGKPVVVSVGDGTESDLIRNGVNGIYVEPDDVFKLREKINSLLTAPELRQVMGQASIDIVQTTINIETMVTSFYNVVTSIQKY